MKYKICGITTRALTLKSFMVEPLNYLSQNGFEAHAICQPDSIITDELMRSVKYIPLEMSAGNVSLAEVFKMILKLYKIFRTEKYNVVQYASTNAGLYASVAAWMAHIPVRVFCQWGVIYTDYKGFKYFFYKSIERLTCFLSTSIQPDSPTNLKYAVSEGLYPLKKGTVIYHGSASGVDLNKYNINKKSAWKKDIRAKYCIPEDAYLFLFVGRLNPEKGINELLNAFSRITDKKVYLMLVGPTEMPSRLDPILLESSKMNPSVLFVGPVSNPASYYAAADMLVLPSYREGFGMVLLEAAALGVPSIISNIKGPTDLIEDSLNGFLCEVKSAESLYETMMKALGQCEEERDRMANVAYGIARGRYNAIDFNQAMLENRLSLIGG